MLYIGGILLNKKNAFFSKFLIGGGLFIEFLSIGVGVIEYGVISEIFGLFFLLGFLLVSIVLGIKFISRIIIYYSLVGGFLIPILVGFYDRGIFVLLYLLFLTLALLAVSFKFDWADVRFFAFFFEGIYLVFNAFGVLRVDNLTFSIFFVILTFLTNRRKWTKKRGPFKAPLFI